VIREHNPLANVQLTLVGDSYRGLQLSGESSVFQLILAFAKPLPEFRSIPAVVIHRNDLLSSSPSVDHL
jgi:hypothetical protein